MTASMRRFGGMDKFSRLWCESLRAAPVGSRRALDMMLAYIRMLQASEANPQPAADLRKLTDAELDRLLGASVTADTQRVQGTASAEV